MFFGSIARVELIGADIPAILRHFSRLHITINNVNSVDALTICFDISLSNYPFIQNIARKYGAQIKIIRRSGIRELLKKCVGRPVLVACILIILVLSAFLPTRILFVETEGTTTLSSKYIIEKAADCGIRLGASRRGVRSEQMKNQLLAYVPQLQWAGINTYGCVAVLSVVEKSQLQEMDVVNSSISSIVASHDGIITSCIVQKGTKVCRVGQAVKAGEVLVSGYIDSGIALQGGCAEAEITAKTLRRLESVVPSRCHIRCGSACSFKKISLQIGKKLINFFKDSGICSGSCVKMYSKKCLTLPGGRTLPLAVEVVHHTHYMNLREQVVASDEQRWLKMSEAYLKSQMIAGEVTHAITEFHDLSDFCQLLGAYSCTETISRKKFEGRIETYG